ncbi:unnamed protein product [Amoebophrya sp. A120]|nr:unnamed protein product [Amoebophrya sp. A120]|eukprot:GSA120T00007386001.1
MTMITVYPLLSQPLYFRNLPSVESRRRQKKTPPFFPQKADPAADMKPLPAVVLQRCSYSATLKKNALMIGELHYNSGTTLLIRRKGIRKSTCNEDGPVEVLSHTLTLSTVSSSRQYSD